MNHMDATTRIFAFAGGLLTARARTAAFWYLIGWWMTLLAQLVLGLFARACLRGWT